MNKGDPQKEYEDISINLRHCGTLQFSQLTVFMLINVAMVNLMFSSNNSIPCFAKIALKVMSLMLSALFLVMTSRINAHWAAYSKRAIELETILDYKQYTIRPPSKLFSNRNAVVGVYLLSAALWILSIVLNL